MTEERDVRLNRKRKMEQWMDSGEGYVNSFRRQDSASRSDSSVCLESAINLFLQ